MKNLLKILLAVFIFFNANEIKPAPFDTGMNELQQPDETSFIGRIWGDEFFWWAETEDGYRFVQSGDGWYYYAQLDENGEFTATEYKVGIDDPPSESYQLERTQARIDEINQLVKEFNEQIELNRQWFAQKQAEAQGQPITMKVGIILIEFTDVKHYKSPPPPFGNRPDGYYTADFDSMMFSINYWNDAQRHPEEEEIFGSFRDYWEQMSLGKLKIEGRVANPDMDQDGVPDWLTANHTKEHYYNSNILDELSNEAITKALNANYIDTINTNAPNYFDKLVIVYAGVARLGGALRVNGHRIGGKYIFLAERSSYKLYHSISWSFTHIGVYAHEFGLNIGFWDEYYKESVLPFENNPSDRYPTDIYNFCLMAFGIYNGPLNKGECPATLSTYYRIDKEWVTPIVLATDLENFIVEGDYYNPKFYRIDPINATNDEHFILENKKHIGFDLYIPGNPADTVDQPGRLLLWHHMVDFSSLGEDEFDRITIVPADNSFNKLTPLTDFFPMQFNPNLQLLNDLTSPGATLGGRRSRSENNTRPAHFALNGIKKLADGNTVIGEVKLNLNLAPDPGYISKTYSQGWDFVSVPLSPFISASDHIFPTATTVYKYSNGYQSIHLLQNGIGYWANFSQPFQLVDFYGLFVTSLSIPVDLGWNILGSISHSVPVPSIRTEPVDLLLAKYKYVQGSGYVSLTERDSIISGSGYWILANSSGTVTLSTISYPGEIQYIAFDNMDKFIVNDGIGNSQILYVANIDIDTSIVNNHFELPPVFPVYTFDSRFESAGLVKKISADSGTVDIEILIQATSFPINLTWEINPANGISYSFINDSIIGKISNISLIGKKSFTNLDNNKIRLSASVGKTNSSNQLPKEFSLEQNYPNPFNPSTVIGYQLPLTGNVTLKVYDVLGSKVATLVDEYREAGRYEVVFDASNLASGIYIYELQAGSIIQSKKMVLAG